MNQKEVLKGKPVDGYLNHGDMKILDDEVITESEWNSLYTQWVKEWGYVKYLHRKYPGNDNVFFGRCRHEWGEVLDELRQRDNGIHYPISHLSARVKYKNGVIVQKQVRGFLSKNAQIIQQCRNCGRVRWKQCYVNMGGD